MATTALLALSLMLAYVGFAALAITQAKHWRSVAAGSKVPSAPGLRRTRVVGWALLGSSLVAAVMRDGLSFGAVLWATAISVAAIAVSATLTWRPNWLAVIAKSVADRD